MKKRLILSEARSKKQWRQTDLAEETGLSQTQLSHLESGRCFPRPMTREKIEAALGIPIDWIGTRLQGPMTSGFVENESEEDQIIKLIYSFLMSDQRRDWPKKIGFIREVADRFEKETAEALQRKKLIR